MGASTRWLHNIFKWRQAEGSGGERASRRRRQGGSSPRRRLLFIAKLPSGATSLSLSFLHFIVATFLSPCLERRKTHRLSPPPSPDWPAAVAEQQWRQRRLSLSNYAAASREGHPPTALTLISQSFSYPEFLFPVGAPRSAASQAGVRSTTGNRMRSRRFAPPSDGGVGRLASLEAHSEVRRWSPGVSAASVRWKWPLPSLCACDSESLWSRPWRSVRFGSHYTAHACHYHHYRLRFGRVGFNATKRCGFS